MPFVETAPTDTEAPDVKAMYDRAIANYGYLPNMVALFSHRPAVMDAWNGLLAAIRGNMDFRRYELVTLAAAQELKSSYCMLAHGSVLLDKFYAADELAGIVNGSSPAVLDAADMAIMAFARKVVRDAAAVTREDVDELRSHGLSDTDIFDVVTAAAVRCFFSKTLDALGATPDSTYLKLDAKLREMLTAGRGIDAAPA